MTKTAMAGVDRIQAGAVWVKACSALKSELGDAAFGSWLAQASLREGHGGALVLVTPTGIARDWIRRNAWRRISELWAQNDPEGRRLDLKSRVEFEAEGGPAASAEPLALEIEIAEPVSSDVPDVAPVGGAGARPARMAGLQERFTFDSFVPGPANEFAYAVARRVASWADGHFNPVLFHGPYGFGKTHLLNALAWEAMRVAPHKKVIYLTAERFLSTFVRALMDRQTAAFKEELRAADLLLIDDVHFIAGKQSTQEELFHTLTALVEDGRRVVFSADRAPSAMVEMDARLRSHLQAGLVCGIEPADRSLRMGILEMKLDVLGRQQGLRAATARPEVLQFLADRFTDSVRELEGALNTLVARLGEGVSTLGLDEAQAILRPHLRGGEKRITIDDIQKAAAEHFGLKQADLISERRNRSIARPRQAAMWLAKQLTTRSLPDIGRRFGGRDHTTVLHAVRRIEALKGEDAQMARDLEALTRKLRG
ncbi:chromosomal replication initiator protein DnaA [Caulobacter sp. CCUG 60055]|uniref:chromosomal replication initiator protein DnaA n=1 Tax=Caulobacter sp. CCUG 60055 TaxID=2100090 RepID=UPI001FA7B216|nr:chromosomal replication initiator protein DnaA [Caulobacter sp. CCUG 60055]MBQ1543409.1 chromosomal replication initiator protein DnaA [Caulobacteraceae bacterium]MCI3179695.1 chromosomal replication initiator protein DnaA [Caulobacter sp. CCUG 60055]